MSRIGDSAHRLANQMQNVIGLLELGRCEEALEEARKIIATTYSVSTAGSAHEKELKAATTEGQRLAAQVEKFDAEAAEVDVVAAEVDVAATEVHRLTAKLARKRRPTKSC